MQLTEMFVLTGEKKASGFLCICPMPNSVKQGQLFLACAHLYRNEKDPTLFCVEQHSYTRFFIACVKEIRNVVSLIFWTPLDTSELCANSGNTVVLPSKASARQEIRGTSHRRDAGGGCFLPIVLMHSVSLAVLIASESGSCSSNLSLGNWWGYQCQAWAQDKRLINMMMSFCSSCLSRFPHSLWLIPPPPGAQKLYSSISAQSLVS